MPESFLEADVVVVGSGAAGFSAALSAQRGGAEVLMLEKASWLGGTTLKSSCWAWYPNHAGVRVDGHVDEKVDAMRYMARLSQPEAYDPASPTLGLARWRHELLEAFYDNAADATEALESSGVHQISLPDFPDYYSFLPENRTPCGRTLKPATASGEGAGADEFIRQGAAAVEGAGGRILTEHAVTRLRFDGDTVVGVVAEHAGQEITVHARRGVVFGSGGFGQSHAKRADYLAAPILGSCAAPGNTGDFIDMTADLGVSLRNMTYPWMTLMVLEQAVSDDPGVKSLFHPPGDSMLFVNGAGRRTLNEKAPYNEMAQMLQRWDVRDATYPDLFQFMVWDQACQDIHANDRPANPIRPAGTPAPHVVSGATLEDLAAALADRVAELSDRAPALRIADDFAAQLRASIDRFNAGARDGEDPDFQRGETPIEQAFNSLFTGGIRDERNPMLCPLANTGPYYATIIVPAALDTKGGPDDQHTRRGHPPRRHTDPRTLRRGQLRRLAGRKVLLGRGRDDRPGRHLRLPRRPARSEPPGAAAG